MINKILISLLILFFIACEKEKPKIDNYLLGTIEFKTNNLVKALDLFKRDYKETKNIKSLYRLAEISRKTGDIHNSENYLLQALNRNKKDIYVINELALLHKRQGRLDMALDYFKKLTSEKEYYDTTYYHIIDIYVYKGKLDEAEQLYKNNMYKIKNRDKINYLFFLNFKKIDDERNKEYLKLVFSSKNLKILTKLLNHFLDEENIQEAYKIAKIIEKDFPNVFKNIRILGLMNLRAENFTEALKYFERAQKLAPDNMSNKIDIALIHIYNGEMSKAQSILNKIISKKKIPEAILLQGFIFYLNKDLNKSKIVISGIRKKIGETMLKKMSFNPLIDFYLMNLDIDRGKILDLEKFLEISTGKNEELLALKIERLNDLGHYKKVIELTKNIKTENQNLLKQLFVTHIMMKNENEAKIILDKIKDNYVYNVWFNYFFHKKCDIEDGFKRYSNNLIYIDIYTDCLIRKQEFDKAKDTIINFVKKEKLTNSDKEYLKKKVLVINYNILKQ